MLPGSVGSRASALLRRRIARGSAVRVAPAAATMHTPAAKKLHGRAFYESIGSPKYVVAPMVDQSEFAWRMLTRSFMPESERSKLLAYTPMLHARLFGSEEKYRGAHFQAVRPGSGELWLDGNPSVDRPLFVQFCANDESALLSAAQRVAPYCDAVDLNLGCPQGIARKGNYGAFLQEDQDLIFRLINTLHKELPVPVTAKIRILDTKEKTLEYAQNVLKAGASILTVHGRRREQKGHMTGLADWAMLRYLRDELPPDTVIFANGNVLQEGDVDRCLEATGADAVMSAEGNLSDPAIFAKPPPIGHECREYWRGNDGRCGWRVDAMMRRYLDILHKYVLDADPPSRRPLFQPGDDTAWMTQGEEGGEAESQEPPKKRRRRDGPPNKPDALWQSPNLSAVQAHLFHLLRHLVTRHTDVRDMLARGSRGSGGVAVYERILAVVERKVAEGLLEYERTGGKSFDDELAALSCPAGRDDVAESSLGTVRRCRRPWWVAQPIIRPLPSEALAKGAITLSNKVKKAAALVDAGATGAASGVDETADKERELALVQGAKDEIAARDHAVAG